MTAPPACVLHCRLEIKALGEMLMQQLAPAVDESAQAVARASVAFPCLSLCSKHS